MLDEGASNTRKVGSSPFPAKTGKWQCRQRGEVTSYVKYELVRACGAVAEVEVDRTTGVIRVPKFTVFTIAARSSIQTVRNQIEGNVIQTVSRAQIEEVTFDRSQVPAWIGRLPDPHLPAGAGGRD